MRRLVRVEGGTLCDFQVSDLVDLLKRAPAAAGLLQEGVLFSRGWLREQGLSPDLISQVENSGLADALGGQFLGKDDDLIEVVFGEPVTGAEDWPEGALLLHKGARLDHRTRRQGDDKAYRRHGRDTIGLLFVKIDTVGRENPPGESKYGWRRVTLTYCAIQKVGRQPSRKSGRRTGKHVRVAA